MPEKINVTIGDNAAIAIIAIIKTLVLQKLLTLTTNGDNS